MSKTVDNTKVTVGDSVRYSIVVKNLGGSTGSFEIRDVLAQGLVGENLSQRHNLGAGQEQRFVIDAIIGEDAPEVIENCAVLQSVIGNLNDCVSIVVERPFEATQMSLVKEVSPAMAKVGDMVSFALSVTNNSQSSRQFELEDVLPEYLDGQDFKQSFELASGASQSFRISARILEGAPETIINKATLSSEGHMASATASFYVVTPPPVPVVIPAPLPEPVVVPASFSIRKVAMQQQVEVGKEASFLITVENTGGSAGQVMLEDNLPQGLVGESLKQTLSLDVGERKSFPVSARVEGLAADIDSLRNEACISWQAEEAMKQCASATISLVHPIVKPEISANRYSNVFFKFGAEDINMALSAVVLASHVPPMGSSYTPGSSRLNNSPIDDPYIDSEGRLYWLLNASSGTLSYNVGHSSSLPPISEPSITIKTAGREIKILGDVSFSALEALGVQETALVARSYSGEIALVPYQVNVGNREMVDIGIELSELALSSFDKDYITVAANLEFVDQDAEPLISGYQVRLDVDGVARLHFEPQTTVKRLELDIAYGETVQHSSLSLLGADSTFYHYQVSATARLLGGDLAANSFAQGYLEMPFAAGSLQAALDVGANYENASFAIDTERGLKTENNPTERFQMTGSGQEAKLPLRSDDGVAVRYDTEDLSIGYHAGTSQLPGFGASPNVTGLHVESRGDVQVGAFAALVAQVGLRASSLLRRVSTAWMGLGAMPWKRQWSARATASAS
ncbi:MAG: hypothetical protein R2880_07090 [Deinococcales bacterium]